VSGVIPLGDWEIGRLGDWEIGRLGDWEIGRLGDWEIGRLGDWEIGRLGFPSCGSWPPNSMYRNFKVYIRKLKKNAAAECRGYSSGFVVATSLC
jgi:hypothetical protein